METAVSLSPFIIVILMAWLALSTWLWIRCTLIGHLWRMTSHSDSKVDPKVPSGKIRHHWNCERCRTKIWHDQDHRTGSIHPNPKFPYFVSSHS